MPSRSITRLKQDSSVLKTPTGSPTILTSGGAGDPPPGRGGRVVHADAQGRATTMTFKRRAGCYYQRSEHCHLVVPQELITPGLM